MIRDDRVRRAVLDAVSRHPDLWNRYVLKGGLALRLAYGSPRPSDDLDFNSVQTYPNRITAETNRTLNRFCDQVQALLGETASHYGFQGMAVQQRTFSDVLPTMLTHVGYTEDPNDWPPFARTVPMQVTLTEVVCETREHHADGLSLHVPVLEDILADKLKAMLQQASRDRARTSDVFDVWYFSTRSEHPIDAERVSAFLLRKARQWDDLGRLSPDRYGTDAVRSCARAGYETLAAEADGSVVMPAFEEAFDAVLRLVDALELPA